MHNEITALLLSIAIGSLMSAPAQAQKWRKNSQSQSQNTQEKVEGAVTGAYAGMIAKIQQMRNDDLGTHQKRQFLRAYARYLGASKQAHEACATSMMAVTHSGTHQMWESVKRFGLGKMDESSLVRKIEQATGSKLSASQVQDVSREFKKWKTNVSEAQNKFAADTAQITGLSTDQALSLLSK